MCKDVQVFASGHRASMWTSNTVLGSEGIELTTIFEFVQSSASLEMLPKLIGGIPHLICQSEYKSNKHLRATYSEDRM